MDSMSRNAPIDQLIELRALTKKYPSGGGEFTALSDVNLSISAGEFVAVVGKSGSGKSTLLNLIAAIDRPTSGELVVAGEPLHLRDESRLATWRGRQVGVVFQFFQLLPTLTVLENTMLPMDFCHTFPPSRARERALELVSRVGIADQADKLPTALSGGQQQRAAIARALANDPPLIVADEPTGNLDTQTAEAVISLLEGLTHAGKTVLMVTHERDLEGRVDRVITLADGRIQGETRAASPRLIQREEASHG
jgi:putative ABC transport system ATP-binding protein